MKKFLISIFALASIFIFSSSKIEASEYNGPVGYQYTSSGAMFYYYTDRNNAKIFVEVNSDSGTFIYPLEKIQNSEGYQGFVGANNITVGDTYRMKVCDATNIDDCEYVLDVFSYHLNTEGNKNVILDTSEVDGKWGNMHAVSTTDYARSIYALDANAFTKNIDTPVGEKTSYSVFDKMILPATKGNLNVGINYLRTLGFSHVEISTLYDENNYFAINNDYTNKSDEYSALNEYQAMMLELKKYNLNIIMRTNFTEVNEQLKAALLAMSSSAVVDDKLNYNDPLVQRYIIDVYKYWSNKYHVDGFYIEDSALYPSDFFNSLLVELRNTNNSLFVYSNSENTHYTTSDKLQNLLIGSLDSLDSKGIVNGEFTQENMSELVEAMFSGYYQNRQGHGNANRTINNFGSLSGLDIYSKINATKNSNVSNDDINRFKLALYTLFASSGTPRVVAGNEFMNTTIINNDSSVTDKICITSSICYAKGNSKSVDWTYLTVNGNLSTLAKNYRNAYSHQYPSLYTLEHTTSIEINQELMESGVLFITFDYDAIKDRDIDISFFVINYSNNEISVNKLSNKSYLTTSPIIGRINETEDGKTKIGKETFYVYTEVKIINIPQWLYLVVGVGLIALIFGFRQFLIHMLHKNKGIKYSEIKNEQNASKKKWFNKGKKIISDEPSVFETYVANDPIIKERKQVAKKTKEARKLKKEDKKQNEKENDGK